MSWRVLFACVACALADGAAQAQDHVVAIGATPTGGIGGVEYIRHPEGIRFGYAVGVGVTGAGARAQYRFREIINRDGFDARYLSLGALVQPFPRNRALDAPLMVTAEYGVEFTADFLYASIGGGGGMAVQSDGGWTPVPSLRFLFGATF